ncbi:mycothiol synthase [Nocardioides sp. CER19]|uniref:mycothiol synthase n=1 Tax=Nocardioides sp. CER19 TaxID=3038538 RepID=UPI00244B73C6|nr:mycothiol synthase [Nocardioides sp. CER19]MDH2413331.1 mycothiol synthase [Nocardioides sp. CER19]
MEHVLAIARESEAADGVAPLDEATVLTIRNRPESARVWEDPDGFALLVGTEVSVVVRPAARGQGLGGRLLSSLLSESDGPLVGWSHGGSPAAAALAGSHGFRPARELWVMRRPMSDPLPALPAAPDGVVVRGFRPGDEDELLRVNAAAFAHHPEQGSLSLSGLQERMAEQWFEPEGLIEAWSGSELLGFHWTKRHSPTLGEVYVVGISPAAQGKGLGRLLTLAGLHHLSDVAEVHLYVEADNTAAVRLYSGLGFTHAAADTHVQFARP